LLGGKTFFFVNYEGYRFPNATTIERTVPTALMRAGVVQVPNSAGVYQAYNLRDTRLMEDTNVGGALSLIRSCEASPGVRRIIQISSATVYGFHPGSTPFVEENPLRPNPNFLYAMHKKRVEALFEEFAARRPDVLVTVLRPSLVAGTGECDPVMSYLRNPVVFLPRGNARLQITPCRRI
jgi:nucleoside-diphosphate-sugar epimerase